MGSDRTRFSSGVVSMDVINSCSKFRFCDGLPPFCIPSPVHAFSARGLPSPADAGEGGNAFSLPHQCEGDNVQYYLPLPHQRERVGVRVSVDESIRINPVFSTARICTGSPL